MALALDHPFVIIGAGLAGLACAERLGERALVLEREAQVGGLARTVARGAFRFDYTGHWLHVASPLVERLLHELRLTDLVRIERRADIHSYGVRTPYPFQAHTYGLPAKVAADCVLGYFAAREAAQKSTTPPRSFEDFIMRRLGDGIARHFMRPYNTKLWTVPPAALDCAWCDAFVPTPTPEEVVQGALAPEGSGHALGYNASFWYPKEGGIGVLAETLSSKGKAEVRARTAATRVCWRTRRLSCSDGTTLPYDVLVSTMPLIELVRMLEEPPEAVVRAAASLRAASVTYWDIGLPRAAAPGAAHWTYFPEPAVPFYRIGSPSAVSPSMAPPGCRSLYVEAAHPLGTSPPADDASVLRALRAVGLVAADEEPTLFSRQCIDYAYVIMDHEYGVARGVILDWLERQGILSVGRYGAWTYQAMEGSLLDGMRAADKAGLIAQERALA